MATIRKVSWKRKDGSASTAWRLRYIDQAGKRRSKNFERKGDAERARIEIEGAVAAGLHVHDRDSITIGEAADLWLEAARRGRDGREGAESSTLRQYRGHVENHIRPALGALRLNRLTTPAVMAWRDELLDAGRSRALVKKLLTSLVGICGEAKGRGYIIGNPAEGVTIAVSSRHKARVEAPSKANVRALVAVARRWIDEPPRGMHQPGRRRWWWLFLRTKAATGLRLSEMRGLAWGHVDLRAGALTVLQRADERGKLGPPKSATGRRRIDLAADLVAALREWRVECPPGELGLVFPNGSGGVEAATRLWARWWVPTCAAAGLVDEAGKPRIGFHALRHFRASVLIESGADVKEVQREMGHASAQMTLDVYGHLFNDEEREKARRSRAARIDAALFG